MEEKKIVAAVGSATATSKGNPVERLMSDEINKIAAESEAIWRDDKLSDAEKQKKIAELNDPDNVRARKLAVRKAYRDERFRKSHETSAAAQVNALKEMAKNL